MKRLRVISLIFCLICFAVGFRIAEVHNARREYRLFSDGMTALRKFTVDEAYFQVTEDHDLHGIFMLGSIAKQTWNQGRAEDAKMALGKLRKHADPTRPEYNKSVAELVETYDRICQQMPPSAKKP